MENQDPSIKDNKTSLLQKFKGPTIGPTTTSIIRITRNLLKNRPLTQQKPVILPDSKQPTLVHKQLLNHTALPRISHPARSSPILGHKEPSQLSTNGTSQKTRHVYISSWPIVAKYLTMSWRLRPPRRFYPLALLVQKISYLNLGLVLDHPKIPSYLLVQSTQSLASCYQQKKKQKLTHLNHYFNLTRKSFLTIRDFILNQKALTKSQSR